MRKYKNLQLLRVTLLLFAGFIMFYGILHLFFPEMYVNTSGGGEVTAGWIRWFGPILIGIGIASIMVYRKPEKQGIFITMLIIGSFGCGLTSIYSLFYDTGMGELWDTLSPMIANFTFSILFLISLRQGRDLLW